MVSHTALVERPTQVQETLRGLALGSRHRNGQYFRSQNIIDVERGHRLNIVPRVCDWKTCTLLVYVSEVLFATRYDSID